MESNENHIPDLSIMKISIASQIKPSPLIYWSDLLLTAIVSWGLFYFAIKFSPTHIIYYFLVFLSAIGLYRAVAFTHELVHLKKDAVPGFLLAWHVVCGIPLLAPHFLYRAIHVAHHSKKNYGKNSDGEYIGFGTTGRWLIAAHLLFNFLIPIVSILRFMVLAPVSLLHPGLRVFVMEKMSFMGLRFSFSRPIPTRKSELISWHVQEFSCSLLCWVVFVLLMTGTLPVIFLFQWYAVMVIILTLNSLRSLGATHWYTSNGEDLSFVDQIRDSISVTSNSLFTKILCPVGTQYHALHHMFPSIPYHSLGKVYRYLLANFPDQKIVAETSRPNLFTSWKEIWSLPRKQGSLE